MCRNYHELEFTHFMVDSSEEFVFGSARVNGRMANFLINGVVKQQSGKNWRELNHTESDMVRKLALTAYNRIPTYRVKKII